VLLKPDCVQSRIMGKMLMKIEDAGLTVCGCKFMRLSPEILQEHYSHIVQFPFYPALVAFMTETPVLALAVQGPNAVKAMRDILGPTDPAQAPKGTIRGDFGADKTRNIMHASDSPENAVIEIQRFFRADEVFER